MSGRLHWIFSAVSSLVVVAALAWGIMIAGSPGTARSRRLDRQRLADLQTISREIQLLCHDSKADKLKRSLPETLDELRALARNERIRTHDPATNQAYAYTPKGDTSYELGAQFSLARDSDVDVFWNHPAGSHCYTINALDPP